MEKLGSILGLPLLEMETGQQIGKIDDILMDIESAAVIALLFKKESGATDKQVIFFNDIFNIGQDAVILSKQPVIHYLQTLQREGYTYYLQDLLNKELLTEAGFRLGILVDIFFNSVTGELHWYQVSDSIITDFLYGRRLMPLPRVQEIGPETIIVPEKMATLLQSKSE